jgi:hypothetical protein
VPGEELTLIVALDECSTASPVTPDADTSTPPSLWTRPWSELPAPETDTASEAVDVAHTPTTLGTARTDIC